MNPDVGLLAGRMLPALLVNLGFGLAAFATGGVRKSGLAGGLLVGIPIYLCLGPGGFVVLALMFFVGTALTRWRYAGKARLGVAEEKGGARGVSHALANAGVAALGAIVAWLTGEWWGAVAFAGALATASMDTAGSEVGPLLGKRTVSLRDFRPVPPGTEGAVSLEGTVAGIAAAAVLAAAGWLVSLYPAGAAAAVVAGAVLGNLYEGVAGSRHWLSHAWLNATNTLVGAGAAVLIAVLMG
jgi:uncharacterized protein (TIGR00297 family)